MAVIRGATTILSTNKPEIALEFRVDKFDELYAPVAALLHDLNYEPYKIGTDGSLINLEDILSLIHI